MAKKKNKKKKKNERLRIFCYDNPILRQKCVDVGEITPELVEFAEKMLLAMRFNNGIGLGSPQVGADINLLVVEIDNESLIMFNPKITRFSADKAIRSEGCLSMPNVHGDVERSTSIDVDFIDAEGNACSESFEDLWARCIQHEVDHLNGIMFIDHLTDRQRGYVSDKLEIIKKREERYINN